MWNRAYIENSVLSADPVRLVQILYEEAIAAVRNARAHLAEGRIRERSSAVSKAMAIVSELTSSLDVPAGGDVASNLAALYAYMQDRLADGNLRQADAPLAEVQSLLATLAEAWRGIGAESVLQSDPTVADRNWDRSDSALKRPFLAEGGSLTAAQVWSA